MMGKEININDVISKAVTFAIKEYDREKREKQKDKIIHNTKLLLKHYNDLKTHIQKAVDDFNKLKEYELRETEYFNIDRSLDDLYIASIKSSKAKTLIMIGHIDVAMKQLRMKQKKLGSSEKYKALEMLYLEEKPYEDLVEYFGCGVNTPRRWVNEMIEELSILLFGLDGLKLEMV